LIAEEPIERKLHGVARSHSVPILVPGTVERSKRV
jgi:hypothetical protein